MFVLHEVFGLEEEKMIAPMDEKRGKLLLAEILDGGNFGRHFTKYAGFTHQSMGKKYFLKYGGICTSFDIFLLKRFVNHCSVLGTSSGG